MNGTTLRVATGLACVAALAVPGSALAAKKHKAVKRTAVVKKAAAPKVTIVVPHKYDWGGDGAGSTVFLDGQRANLFDPVEVAEGLGNKLLRDLGLPPLPALPTP